MDTSERWLEPSRCQASTSTTAWIPGNYLNEGLTTVDVSIASLGAPKLLPHASGRSAVAFHVQDPAEGDSARGLFTGQWQGVVRPMLEWTTEGASEVRPDLMPGPMEAIETFLATTTGFEIDRSREKFLLTSNRRGYLRKGRSNI